MGGIQVKLLFPGGVYDTKYLAHFFPKLLPTTSLEDLHTYLAPKADDGKEDDVGGEDVEESNEQSASVPGAVDLNGKEGTTLGDPICVVHNVNGEGVVESSTLQGSDGTSSAHVILADLSPCKSIDLHFSRASDNVLAKQCIVDNLFWLSFCYDEM